MRDIFEEFISNCGKYYIPGEYITIDEQLLGFRGRCSFRLYNSSKPAKYGINIIRVCDSASFYMVNAMPYLGRHTIPPRGMPLAQYVTEKLVAPYENSGRCITGDNWFSSIPLINSLLTKSFSYVGTLRSNKRELPPQITDKKMYKKGQSAFIFDNNMTVVGFMPPQKK